MSRSTSTLRLLLPLLLLLASFGFAVDYPLTVTDYLGRSVTLDSAPRSVVSLMASHTETLVALGALDVLVAVDEHSDWPEAVTTLPTVGNGFQPNIEEIVLLEPDLVLTDQFSGAEQVLTDLGLTVFAGTPQAFDDIFSFQQLLGTLLDREDAAAALNAQLQQQLLEIATLTGVLTRVSVFVELDPTPFSVGPESYIGVLLDLAGGENIMPAELGDWPQVEPEFVIQADPAVILLLDAPHGENAESVAARPGWSRLQAVMDGGVLAVTVDEANALSRPGPRVAYAAAILAQKLHPLDFPAGSFDARAFEPALVE